MTGTTRRAEEASMTEWHGYPHAAAPSHDDAAPSLAARLGVVANWAGALLSVALLAGVATWSYRLMVRDISGVPVVRALDGPMRISPEDPGGRQAAYQGLAVNAVAAGDTPPPVVDAVALAPSPVDLAEEDRPAARVAAPSPAFQTDTTAAGVNALGVTEIAATAARAPDPATAVDAAREGEPVEVDVLPADVAGIARSPFPSPRPDGPTRFAMARGQSQSVSDADAADAEAEAILELLLARLAPGAHTEIDPETLPVGTRLVQLGAFPDAVGAREAWDELATRFSAAFDGRARVIEPAVSAGRTLYRLRAHGFADEPEARRFCALLVAEGADCVPVLIR
jgi:hypothetical protein